MASDLDQANEMFHTDSSFNGRRAGHSLLLAHKIPPQGTGGHTEVRLRVLGAELVADT